MKRDSLGILGLIIGIIGVGLSIYFYYQAERKTEAVFLVEPKRTEILSVDRIGDAPISVTKADGEKINDDLTAIRFYFWNNGNESIKKDNILKPIKLDVLGPEVEIVDFSVLKLSRDITGISVTRDKDNSKSSLNINFSILEPGDGFTGQILLEGPKDSLLSISGIIEDTPGIITNSKMVGQRFWPVYLKSIVSILVIVILFIVVPFGMVTMHEKCLNKIKSEFIKKIIHYTIWIGTGLLIIVSLIYSFVLTPISDAKKQAASSIVSVVPVGILPNK